MTPEDLVLLAIISCIAGAPAALLGSRSRSRAGGIAFGVTLAAAIMILTAAATVLVVGPSARAAAVSLLPVAGLALSIHVDGLSALFLLLSACLAVAASFYSLRYLHSYEGYGAGRYYPNFLLFLAALYGLLTTTDMMWFFFIFWQLMTLPGYALIRYENRKAENIRAAKRYLVMMQIACAATMVGAWLIADSGSPGGDVPGPYDFEVVSANLPALLTAQPGTTTLAFALFLAGFGIKMGMWPFGTIWLPDAHPAAPSPVSALLSGVMIKTGVYGLVRYFLWLVPAAGWQHYPLAEWGMVIAVLGTITLVTGTLQALRQDHAKRLLAFHSIGQIGYILLGTGACMALLSGKTPELTALATLGLFGALYHVINHGLFKGLLFLNAGSLRYATGTQDVSRLGGLMKFMPMTALTALVASLSISGVPLLNGFVSKWSIVAASIQGSGTARYLAVCAVLAILTSGVTLASFMKFFGGAFLSRPSALVRSRAARHHRFDVPWLMQTPQVLLAVLCVLLGFVPAAAFRLLEQVLHTSRQGFGAVLADAVPVAVGSVAGVQTLSGGAVFVPLALAALLGAGFLLVRIMARAGGAARRAAEPWLCGYVTEADCHRYTAHHFYGEIKQQAAWMGGAVRQEERDAAQHQKEDGDGRP